MILRPRQVEFVDKCVTALTAHGNTLGVAPTGCGKTVMLSSVAGRAESSLVIQHRDELVEQNRATFKAVNPGIQTDIFNAGRKRFCKTGATFAMIQTLMRDSNIGLMRPVQLLVIDEAHHVAAEGYKKVIEAARTLNPHVAVFGVTATPMRADKKALASIFTNVADVVQLAELIQAGHLVRPRTFVIDCGLREELRGVKKTLNEFDMGAVEAIMDKMAVNEKVFEEWAKLAADRQTVIFCSTIEHARHVLATFTERGVAAGIVTGDTDSRDRKETLAAYDRKELQVLVNVAVLTEGWDHQPTSCVVLLRPCSHKSTMLQMIGRGLRKVCLQRYPGVLKDDCIVLDFGYSLITHGNLDIDIELDPQKKKAEPIECPSCGTLIPAFARECPVCGSQLKPPVERSESGEREALTEFILTEVDLMESSPYRWEELWPGSVMMANALTAWAAMIPMAGRFVAVGGLDAGGGAQVIHSAATRIEALASADDFLREHGDSSAAKKTKSWLSAPASDKQLQMLQINPQSGFGLSRYRASCQLTWKFNERYIKAKLTK